MKIVMYFVFLQTKVSVKFPSQKLFVSVLIWWWASLGIEAMNIVDGKSDDKKR